MVMAGGLFHDGLCRTVLGFDAQPPATAALSAACWAICWAVSFTFALGPGFKRTYTPTITPTTTMIVITRRVRARRRRWRSRAAIFASRAARLRARLSVGTARHPIWRHRRGWLALPHPPRARGAPDDTGSVGRD